MVPIPPFTTLELTGVHTRPLKNKTGTKFHSKFIVLKFNQGKRVHDWLPDMI